MKRTLALSLLLAASTEAASIAARDADCKDVHIFLARGNNEPYPGRQGKLVNAICQNLDSCDYEDIKFYNPGNSNYCTAVSEGSANGVAQITAYNQKCPNTKLVVSGYSQGADVAGNVLGGGGGNTFGCVTKTNAGLGATSQAGKKIAAALIFGDVRHTANQPYNVLDGASHDGDVPRNSEMLQNLAAYGDALRSWCAAGDPICAKGSITADHLNYFDLYTNSAAEWVLERLKAVDSTSPSSTAKATKTDSAPTKKITAAPTKGWSNGTSYVTVPAYGHDIDTITYKPVPVTAVVTEYATVTSDCPEKGSVYTQTKTVTVECPICQYVSKYSETATGHISKETSPSGGSYSPGGNSTITAGHFAPGSSSKPTPVPNVPEVGTSAASAHLPQLGGALMAIAALLAL